MTNINRLAAHLAVVLLLLTAGEYLGSTVVAFGAETALAAKCVEYKGGCVECSPNGSTCIKCDEGFGLTSMGNCVECKVPPIDDENLGGQGGFFCATCDGDQPRVCLRCQNNDDFYTNAYVTKMGRCAFCPDRTCSSCLDRSGKCVERESAYIGGWCPEGCQTCHGPRNKKACTSCTPGYGLVNRKCVRCQDALCWGCGTNPAKCKRCNNYTYKDVTILLDKRSGRCVPPRCSVNNCRLCRDGRPRQCAYCKAGYTASESGACVPRKPAAKAD